MKIYVFIVLSMLIGACSRNNPKSLKEDYTEAPISDTAICPNERLSMTPYLDDALNYFKKNNRFANWDQKDKKRVIVRCIIEKNGKASHIKIRHGSGIKKLDMEAIRLISNAKVLPGQDVEGKTVRANWIIFVDFPTK